MKKKIIILENGGGRLANQLWNFISIFAYSLERGYDISNHAFTDYYSFFKVRPKNWLIRILSIQKIKNNRIMVFLRPYRQYINYIKRNFSEKIIDSGVEEQFYLPPSPFKNESHKQLIENFENNKSEKNNVLYTTNWMFRNPVGIQKFRKEIVEYFRPRKEIEKRVVDFITKLRQQYTHIVGVHIRQGDFKTFLGGSLYFEQTEVRKMLDEYLSFSGLNQTNTVFVLCSDGLINTEIFLGLKTIRGLGGAVDDIFTLSKTDVILGSDSTFGAFASYYGNVPLVIFERPMVDWEYYRGKTGFFENKKSRVVFY